MVVNFACLVSLWILTVVLAGSQSSRRHRFHLKTQVGWCLSAIPPVFAANAKKKKPIPFSVLFSGEAQQDVSQPTQRQEPDLGSAGPFGRAQPAQHGQCAGYGGPTGGEHHWCGEQAQLILQHPVCRTEQPSV